MRATDDRTPPTGRRRKLATGVTVAAIGALLGGSLVLAPMVQAEEPGVTADRGLHVQGKTLVDGNGEEVVFRGVEHIIRWGDYTGSAPWGDVPWEGAANDVAGAKLGDIAKTGANSVRILGGKPAELENLLHKAVVEHKMFVSIARVNWRDPVTVAAIKKYSKYVTLHIKGETTHQDDRAWRTEAIRDVTEARKLGYTSPIEVFSTSYGQRLSTILAEGKAVFEADPLKNVVFGYQLYSELAKDVNKALDSTKSFPHPIMVGACLFEDGIKEGWGNTANTYKEVWDGTAARQLSSFYWAWNGGNSPGYMSANGSLTDVGKYLVDQSRSSLKKYAPKTKYLLDAPKGSTPPVTPSTSPSSPAPSQSPPAPTPTGTAPVARTGKRAVALTARRSWQSVAQTVTGLAANSRHTATVFVKGTGTVQLRIHAGSWGPDLASHNCVATGEWKACTVSFQAPRDGQVVFRLTDSTASGSVTIDDTALTAGSGTTNRLTNGGFESGADRWLVQQPFSLL